MSGDVLCTVAAVIGLAGWVIESQRRTNAQTSARNWHRSFELEHRVVEAQATVIRRLETALGRPTRHWLPLGHQPHPGPPPPTYAELAGWLVDTCDAWTCPAAHLGETFIPLDVAA